MFWYGCLSCTFLFSKESVLSVVKVIKHMLSEQCFNRVFFTKHLTSKVREIQTVFTL